MSRANVVFSVLSLLDCHSHVFIFNGQKDLKHSEIERGREEGCRGGNNKKCWCWLLYCYIVSMYNIYLLGRSVYGMRLLKDREGLKRTTSAKRRNFLMCSRKLVLPSLMAQSKNEDKQQLMQKKMSPKKSSNNINYKYCIIRIILANWIYPEWRYETIKYFSEMHKKLPSTFDVYNNIYENVLPYNVQCTSLLFFISSHLFVSCLIE